MTDLDDDQLYKPHEQEVLNMYASKSTESNAAGANFGQEKVSLWALAMINPLTLMFIVLSVLVYYCIVKPCLMIKSVLGRMRDFFSEPSHNMDAQTHCHDGERNTCSICRPYIGFPPETIVLGQFGYLSVAQLNNEHWTVVDCLRTPDWYYNTFVNI